MLKLTVRFVVVMLCASLMSSAYAEDATPAAAQTTTSGSASTTTTSTTALAAPENAEPLVVLKPKMRPEALSSVLYTIRTDELNKYLDNMVLFDSLDDFERLPYVVGFDRDRNMGAEGYRAYTMGIKSEDVSSYSILVAGRKLIDPCTDKVIGLQADVIGSADLLLGGSPQTIMITSSTIQVDQGSRLIPRVGLDLPEIIEARYPEKPVRGFVLSVQNAEVGVGNYAVVVLSVGRKHGVFQGCVLNLLDGPRKIFDQYTREDVCLPPFKYGEVMIYKVGKKISLGIITFVEHSVKINDIVMFQPQL